MQVDIQNDGPVTIQLDSVTKGKVRNVASPLEQSPFYFVFLFSISSQSL